MQQLHITISPVSPEPPQPNWATPVGWWRVFTDGDPSGYTQSPMGVFYGHLAEVALSLADQAYFGELNMIPVVMPVPLHRPHYVVRAGAKVLVTMITYGSPFNKPITDEMLANFRAWLDCDVLVSKGHRYQSYLIQLPPDATY